MFKLKGSIEELFKKTQFDSILNKVKNISTIIIIIFKFNKQIRHYIIKFFTKQLLFKTTPLETQN